MSEILKEVFPLQDKFGTFLLYLTKPGVITGLLIALGWIFVSILWSFVRSYCIYFVFSVWVYYLREKSIAQRGMVLLLQEMLVTEAKDKEFLLSKISHVTEGSKSTYYFM